MKLDFGLVQLIISRVSSLFTGAGLWTFLIGCYHFTRIQSSPFSMYIILYWHLWKCKRYSLSLELITYWRRIKKTFGKCTDLCLTHRPHTQMMNNCPINAFWLNFSSLKEIGTRPVWESTQMVRYIKLKVWHRFSSETWNMLVSLIVNIEPLSCLRDLLWSF